MHPPHRAAARRLPHPPGRRGPLWLAALVAGAVLAGLPSVLGSGPQVINADASDYGLGVASDLGISGGMDDTDVRQGLTQAEAQARLSELAASRAAREPKTVVPVTEFRLTTCYCMRWGQMHYGLDMAAPLGTPIYSAVDGVVIRAGSASGFGNAVYIQDADGNVHIYGHMRYYDVEAGDIVHAGDEIAQVGNEGYSTGPHLHYEIHQRRRGRATDRSAGVPRRARRPLLTQAATGTAAVGLRASATAPADANSRPVSRIAPSPGHHQPASGPATASTTMSTRVKIPPEDQRGDDQRDRHPQQHRTADRHECHEAAAAHRHERRAQQVGTADRRLSGGGPPVAGTVAAMTPCFATQQRPPVTAAAAAAVIHVRVVRSIALIAASSAGLLCR